MATKKLQIYKCEICGNVVELLHAGPGELVCCGQPMKLMVEQTADFTKEKHVPIVKEVDNGVMVIIGSTPHPMKPEHYIEWIEVHTDDTEYRQYLNPGDAPEAFFPIAKGDIVMAREWCNIHLLWKS